MPTRVNVFVTGANGLVGLRLCEALARAGHDVTGISRGPWRVGPPPAKYLSVDFADTQALGDAVRAARPDVIINPGSMTDVDGCEKDPHAAWVANAAAPETLARAANDVGAHLVHVSTDYVFDGEAGPYAEDAIPNPKGAYAQSKYAGELAVRTVAKSWAIARTAVVYGWPQAGRPNFGAWIVSSLEQKKPLKLFVDQFVSPSLARNVAAMLAELGERKLSGIWNICGASVVNRLEFASALCEVFGFDKSLLTGSKLADAPLTAFRPKKSGLNTARTAAELKAKPLALADALAQFHAEYKGASP